MPWWNLTAVLIRRQRHGRDQCHVKTHVGKRQTYKDRGRDWSYSSANQEKTELAEARRTKEWSVPCRFSKEHGPANTWFWIIRLQNCERRHCFCFKALGLWYFITAILGNQGGSLGGFRQRSRAITPGHSKVQMKKQGDFSFESLRREAIRITFHIESYCKPNQKPKTSERNKITIFCLG